MKLIVRFYILGLFICNFLSYDLLSYENLNQHNDLNIPSEFEKIDFIQKDRHSTPFEFSETIEKESVELGQISQKVFHGIYGGFHTLSDVILHTPKKLLSIIDLNWLTSSRLPLYVLYRSWKTHL